MNQCDGCRVRAPLTDRGNHQMPDGGFMACTKDRYKPDLGFLKSELKWCVDNGHYGPRTGAVLREALELVEELEKEKLE
jgi:hypothetical protein